MVVKPRMRGCATIQSHFFLFPSVNLGGSIYLNMALGVVIEVPSYLMCAFGMDSLGRRALLIATQLTCALFSLGSLLIPEGVGSWAVVACSTLAKFATTAAFTVVILQVSVFFYLRIGTDLRIVKLRSATAFSYG